jgi:hypothetical protein
MLNSLFDHAPDMRVGSTVSASNSLPTPIAVPQVRPWVRYWARMLDLYILGTLAGLAIGVVAPRVLSATGSDELLGFACLFVWVFVEAFLLSTIGTTPGKWLLRSRLVPNDGGPLSYSKALDRCFKVWWRGLGAGIPLVSLITLIVAHDNLTKHGITSWDKDQGFAVLHERIGPVRTIAACVVFFALSALVAVGISPSG